MGRLVQPGKESEDKNSQLVLGMVWEPVSFNPLRGIDSGSYCASSLVYEGLVKFDENLDLVGGLAESFSVSQDGLTYRFRLRPNLRYSDGEKIEAADIKASLLLGASSISPFRSDYKD
ncbi:MAG TPA: ABC transporter substrate-binding protein, partial [Candidatus Obscuribacter sp.]|nr:ABC transporter substrate-binding protein [Candidatus Obscuribacter sp.]